MFSHSQPVQRVHLLPSQSSVLAFALIAASFLVPFRALAQADANSPTALIVTYRAAPGQRARLRAIMKSQGVPQLETWKHEDVFAGYRLLFTTYAGSSAPDMFLILRFRHFTDLENWQKIEETNPGGLPLAAQNLASPLASATADIVKEDSVAPSTHDSQFLVLEYDVLIGMPGYVQYVLGYAAPQFDEWEKSGVLSSYASYVNQNPAGAPWSAFILLEYKDLKSLAAREIVKDRARADLAASNPAWKKWSEDKTAVRVEKAAIPARALNLP